MKRTQALEKACFLLREQAKEESLARFLLQYILDETTEKFNSNMNVELEKELEKKYFGLIEEHINKDAPLSHLVGFEYFYNRKFKVNKNVLSPRMETEELIYKILNDFKYCDKEYLKILDLCTGSGIIGITLEKELKIETSITASDISREALKVARKNAKLLQSSVYFIESNLFENIEDKFDIIVSNPPYISYEDMDTIKKNVLDYDPHIALFSEEEGMYFYKRIVENADQYLKENGKIYFEIGYNQRERIQDIARNNKFICQVIKDINGKDRIAILFKEK